MDHRESRYEFSKFAEVRRGPEMQKSRGLERKFNISATAGRIVLWLRMVEDDVPIGGLVLEI